MPKNCIAQVTAVTTPTDNSTPDYTFSSDEAGTISYGGSCLPKDLKALNAISQSEIVDLPILKNVESSNLVHTNHIINKILDFDINKIGIFGLAFKSNTDDLRFSKSIDICEILIGKGMKVKVFDNAVNTSKLIELVC